ncbi:unnamed protein product [Closterium sp. NIES-65]|nr:unnamed protein product [Closterium sp. NIES-65]
MSTTLTKYNTSSRPSLISSQIILTGFFFLWWQQQGETMRNRVRKLVASGQLEFINGGWVMHDEAVCHYTDMVHQMSMGHRFIQEHFNITPRVAWQIDPFGHSATQASLITSQGGLDAFIFGRADYKDMEKRKAEQKMEFVWRAGTGAPRDTQVFTGILYDGYYSPQEFRYQQTDSPEYRFRDWPNERNPNVEQFVNFFVQETLNRARAFRTNHLLFPMGEDFSFNEAIMWFKNMDKLIHYVNLDGRVNALYSTPSLYVDAVQKENKTWPLKTGDMFPYADAPNFVWTGYFASRANFKRFARACSSLLLATTILEAAVGKTALRDWGLKTHRMIATDEFLFDNHLGKNLKPTSGTEGAERGGAMGEGGGGGSGEGGVGGNVESGEWEEWERVGAGARRRRVASTFPLEEAVAVAQHHDAITGTAQQHVNDDYTIRLHRAAQEASTVVAAALVHLITQAAPTTLPPRSSSPTSSSTPQDPSRAFFTPTADPTMGPSDFPPFNDPTLDPAAQLQAQPWDPVDLNQPQSFPEKPTLETASPFDPPMPDGSEPDPLFSQLHPELTHGDAGSNEGEPQHSVDTPSFFPYNRQVPPLEETLQSQQTVQWTDANQQEQPSGTVDVHAPQEEVSPGRRGQEIVLRGRGTSIAGESSRVVGGNGESGEEVGGSGIGAGSSSSNRGRRLLREGGSAADARQGNEGSEQASTEGGDRRSASEGGATHGMPVLDFQMCPLLNLSYCPPSETKLSPDQVLVVTVFNPLGWPRTEIVRFPVSSPSVLVTDSSNSPIPAQIVTETLVDPNTRAFYVAAYTGQLPQEPQQSQQQPQQPGQQEGQMDGAQQQQEGRQMSVVFRAEVPPLGYTTFFLTAVPPGTQGAAVISTTESAEVPALKDPTGTPNSASTANSPAENIVLGGFKADSSSAGGAAGKGTGAGKEGESALRVTFSKAAYGMTQMELVRQTDGEQVTVDVVKPVRSDVLEYVTQKGGAYIFDPTTEAANPTQRDDRVSIRVQRGPIVEEFSRQVAPWISETFRVYPGCDYAELHYVIGPTPEDSKGHEVVTRFSAPINSNKTFFTDSNGRRYLKRIVDHRADWELTLTDPIAGNFYPVTVGAFIGDGESQLSLLVDRAAGAASLAAGQLEVMLHRALVTVDMKGVGEILNEQIAFNGNNERLMVIGSIRFGLHPGGSTGVADEEHDEEQPTATTSAVAPADADTATATPHGRRGAETDGGGGKEEANQGFSEMGRPRERRGGERQEGEGGGKGQGAEWRRVHAQRLIAPLQLAFAVETKEAIRAAEATHRWRYSISQGERASNSRTPKSAYSLPPNVAVISFQELSPRNIVLRLAHLYELAWRLSEPKADDTEGERDPAATSPSFLQPSAETLNPNPEPPPSPSQLAWRLSDDPPKPDDTEEERDPAFRSSLLTSYPSLTPFLLSLPSPACMAAERRPTQAGRYRRGEGPSLPVVETFCFLAKHKLVDVIVTTAGGIEEDVIKCLAPTLLGDFSLAGKDLRAKGLNRIGNLLVPNNNYCLFEDWVLPVLDACLEEQKTQGVVWTPSKLIDRLGKEINHEESVLYWAHKNGISVFCPAITDGSLGDMIYFHSFRSPGLLIDLVQGTLLTRNLPYSPSSLNAPWFPPYIQRMNGEAVNATPRHTGRMNSVSPHPNNNSTPAAPLLLLLLSSPSSPPPLFPPDIRRMNGEAVNATPRRTGVIILGGGLPKHHICNANMMRNGADYAVYINTASEFDGSDSGARPDEAVSWGKIRGDASAVKVRRVPFESPLKRAHVAREEKVLGGLLDDAQRGGLCGYSEFDGSDSGARPDEAVSWGMIREDATAVKLRGRERNLL